MPIYQVKNWRKTYENSRSRQVENCSFVCVPNKQHGMGFTYIIAQPDGAAILGVWLLILEACSLQTSREGWLTDTGTSHGRHWSVTSMALRWRRTEEEIQRALDVLTSQDVGWIEVYSDGDIQVTSDCRPSDVQVTSKCVRREEKGIEEKGREEATPPPPSVFYAAWDRLGKPFSKIQAITQKRRAALKARMADAWWRDHWREGLTTIAGLPFCRGENNRNWVANVDWFLRPDTLAKIFEGAYNSSQSKPQSVRERTTDPEGGW